MEFLQHLENITWKIEVREKEKHLKEGGNNRQEQTKV